MAQTIKHRRGKLESIAGITPINGELIIASGSDLSVHQEGLLFVGVEGNVLTPSNKILTGSAAIDVTGGSFDHSVDGIPYYDTDDKKLFILGHGGNTNVTFTTNSLDLKASGIVSSSTQVSALAGIEDSTLTITAGDGLKTGGSFTTNQSSNTAVTLDIDVSDFAGTGLEDDGSENLRLATQGTGIDGGGGSTLSITAAQTGITSVLNASLKVGRDADNDIDFSTDNTIILRAGGEDQLTLTDGALTPSSNGIVDLGTDALEFKDGFFDGTLEADAITIGGTNIVTGGVITSLGTVTAGNVQGILPSGVLSGSAGVGALVTDAAIDETADSIVFFDGDSTLKREAIDDFLTAIAGTNLSVSSGQLTANAGDITGVTAGSGITQGGTSGTVVVGVDSGSLAGSGLVAPAGGAININVDDSTVEINSDTLRVKDSGITLAKIADIADDRILGNISGGSAAPSALTAANVRTMINVADGAQANVATNLTSTTAAAQITINSSTGTNVVIAEASDTIAGLMSTTHHDKLDGIEAGATADQTGAEIATALNSDLGGNFTIGNQSSDTATFSGGVTIAGDLTVNGTTTSVNSTTVNIGDNILELNYAGTAADAGILVKDAVSTGTSGSLLWDASEDYWIAGALGSEARVVVGTGTTGDIVKFSAAGVIADSILSESGTTLTVSNNVIVSGLTASQLVATNGSKQLVSTTDISALTLTLDGGEF